ncbi:MAG: hypothetical protein ACTSRX_00445 [Promethearchaeota archaeon]
MSENFRTGQSVEIPIIIRWWLGLIITPIMPIFLVIASFTTPNFKEIEGMMLIIIITAIYTVANLTLSLLLRKVIKRFSVDSATRSLVFELFWSGLRIYKRTYPFEIINKFDLVYRNMKKSRYARIEQVVVLTLTFQSEKIKYITGILDRDNLETWANQLNNLLKDQGGFPAEYFVEPLTPHWPDRDQKSLKLFFIISIFVVVLVTTFLIILVLTGVL